MEIELQHTVQVSRYFDAPAERVFDAWLDPNTLGQWLFATPTGQMVRVDIDPHVGGSFCIIERRGEMDAEHLGEYLEIHRPNKLVFLFSVCLPSEPGLEKYSDATRVTIDIEPQDSGCLLTLTHDNVLPDYASRTQEGWTNILAGLEKRLLK